MDRLSTTAEVVDALGGYLAVAEITGSKPKAVSNWPRAKTFPAKTFLILQSALKARGMEAPISLWGMAPAPTDGDDA